MAIQQVGESTCSLGEVRNRADLVVFWGADPATSHPRHFERYSVDAKGLFVPRGRADRHVIVIDSEETETSRLADTFIKIRRGADFDVIWALRQLLRGIELPESADVGVPHEQLRQLAQQMSSCRYGAVFFGLGLAQSGLGTRECRSVVATGEGPQRLHSIHRSPAAHSGRRGGSRRCALLADRICVCRQSGPRVSALQSGRV